MTNFLVSFPSGVGIQREYVLHVRYSKQCNIRALLFLLFHKKSYVGRSISSLPTKNRGGGRQSRGPYMGITR
jgi:hypothetical protein